MTHRSSAREDQRAIKDQRLFRQHPIDRELARAWLWQENLRTKQLAAGFNIASDDLVDFILSIPDWKTLTNVQLRGLLRVKGALDMRIMLEAFDSPFATQLAQFEATVEDLELWRRILPDINLPAL